LTYLRNIKNSYPEIYTAISTRQAIRTMLNAERHSVERLLHRGRINSGEAEKMNHSIEIRMKKLLESPPAFDLPKSIELLKGISWLKDLEPANFKKIVEMFQNRIFSADQELVKEGGKEEGLYVIVRGKVLITVDGKVIDMLGPGNVVGEMSILTHNPRSATATAESPVTTMWISSANMKKAMHMAEELEVKLWDYASARFVENLLSSLEPYNFWQQDEFREWISSGEIDSMKEGSTLELNGRVGVLLSGQVYKGGEKKKTVRAPVLIEEGDIIAEGTSRVFFANRKSS